MVRKDPLLGCNFFYVHMVKLGVVAFSGFFFFFFFYYVHVQSCLTLYEPLDSNPPGTSILL